MVVKSSKVLDTEAKVSKAAEREAAKKPYKRFLHNTALLGVQLFDDAEMRNEILQDGLINWLHWCAANQ